MKIDLGFVLAMGPLVTSSMYFFSLAYRIGPASFVAPFEYSGMIWAVVFGLLFWGDAKPLDHPRRHPRRDRRHCHAAA